jgi:hypothetical protein
MKLTTILLIILIPAMLHPGEYRGVVSWKAGIAIDMTGVPADKSPNPWIMKKGM